MDRPSSGAVVAGTRAFTIALLAPLTARVGSRPRIAGDVAQALALCPGPGGAAVIEYAGEGSLPDIERLVRAGVRVVVAVPPERLAAVASIRALGAEPVRWDGRPELVVAAVVAEPPLGAAAGASAIAVVGPPPRSRAEDANAASPAAAPFFGDLGQRSAATAEPLPADARAPARRLPSNTPLPAAIGPAVTWPAATPGPAEAAEALARSLAGALPADVSLGAVAERVVAALSALEREVLAGDPQPFDAAPVRAAAVMRLRVAAALAAAPPPGAPVDGGALHGILGEIDRLLAEVKGLLATAPDPARPGLEAVRNALVREAIAFSESAAGRAPGDAAPAAPAPAPRRAASAPRMLPAEAQAPRRRPVALLVLLALAAAGALGFHAWDLHARPAPTPPATFPGAPAGTFGVDRGSSRLLMTLPGARVDPAELDRFSRLEAAKGNAVRAISPGAWLIERAPPAEATKP